MVVCLPSFFGLIFGEFAFRLLFLLQSLALLPMLGASWVNESGERKGEPSGLSFSFFRRRMWFARSKNIRLTFIPCCEQVSMGICSWRLEGRRMGC